MAASGNISRRRVADNSPVSTSLRRPGAGARSATGAIEALAQLQIAGPLVLASLVNMGMSITDVIMMGSLGPVSLAAGAVASDCYSIVFYLCAGVLAASSALLAHARGSGQHRVVRRLTQQAFWAAGALALPGAFLTSQAPKLLGLIGVAPEIVRGATAYAGMMALTLVPMLGVTAWRQLLSAFADTRAIFRVTLVTLALNALGNYVFMFGKLGLPAMGLAGAGLSSALCGTFMFAALTAHALRSPSLARYRLAAGPFRPDWSRLGELFRLGLPIGISSLGELGVYLLSTAVIGIFGTEALAAHAVALRSAGVLYALPVGLAQAATVRVGLAAGAGDRITQRRAARTALAAACLAALVVSPVVIFLRHDIAAVFITANGGSGHLVTYASQLLLVLAAMQIFEYVGTAATGVLRGVQDTRVPMLMSVCAFWGVAALIGLGTGFGLRLEALGIWLGLGSGAITYCVLLLARIGWHGDALVFRRRRAPAITADHHALLPPSSSARGQASGRFTVGKATPA